MARRVPPLSSTQVAKLKPDPNKTIELVDGAVPGLRLRVTPLGTRSWSLNVRAAGIMRRFDVGAGLGLAEARQKATQLRRNIQAGGDPTAERRALRRRAKDAQDGIDTLGAMVDEYYATGPGAGLNSRREQLRRIRSVFTGCLNQPSLDLTPPILQTLADDHPSKSSAARAVAYISPILAWGYRRGRLGTKFELEKPHIEIDPDAGDGQTTLNDAELRTLLPYLKDPHGLCCKLILLTGTRRQEAAEASWAEIDFDNKTWTIASTRRKDTRSKTRRKQVPALPHVIPLSNQAIYLLKRLQDDGAEGLVFQGERGGRLDNWYRWLKRLSRTTGVQRWSAHSLRRTTATIAANFGADPHVISVILGHKNIGGQLTATYNKSRYHKEHTAALQTVADHLDRISFNIEPALENV